MHLVHHFFDLPPLGRTNRTQDPRVNGVGEAACRGTVPTRRHPFQNILEASLNVISVLKSLMY
jgi:hypothetical protein